MSLYDSDIQTVDLKLQTYTPCIMEYPWDVSGFFGEMTQTYMQIWWLCILKSSKCLSTKGQDDHAGGKKETPSGGL